MKETTIIIQVTATRILPYTDIAGIEQSIKSAVEYALKDGHFDSIQIEAQRFEMNDDEN
jgi:hypothetical protein